MHVSIKYILVLTFSLRLGLSFSQLSENNTLSKEFHKSRREALRQNMPDNSVAVFFSNPIRNRSSDVDYVYHQHPDFYYFTGYREPHAVLLIFKEVQSVKGLGKFDEIIFVRPNNPFYEMWNGKRLGPDGVKKDLGIRHAYDHAEFQDLPLDFTVFDKVLFLEFKEDVRDTEDPYDLYDLIARFKEKVNYPSGYDIDVKKEIKTQNLDLESLPKLMDELRGIKTPEEILLLQRAIDISCVGQIEVMKAMKPGMSELEIQGIHEFVFRKYGAEFQGYPSIVGAGHNGCILHYTDNNKPHVNSSELVLMDVGAEYRGYTADVTRTIPVNGKFSDEQRAIYNLVLKAQEAAIKECRPGVSFVRLNELAQEVITRGLWELGIIKSENEQHSYFPHGVTHHLGLDVHDRGQYDFLRENMVITIEPGIYIPAQSSCDRKWWDIAVRIEDDILITKDGPVNMSATAPKTIEDIEKLMAEKSPLDEFVLPELGK